MTAKQPPEPLPGITPEHLGDEGAAELHVFPPASDGFFRTCLRRVVTAWVPGMTAQDSANSFPAAHDDSIFANRFDRVLAASGGEPTGRPQQRADPTLVEANQANRQAAQHFQVSFAGRLPR
jgi:hypothetical protein